MLDYACHIVLCCVACCRAVSCYATGTSALVADRMTLTPPKVESYFGISRGMWVIYNLYNRCDYNLCDLGCVLKVGRGGLIDGLTGPRCGEDVESLFVLLTPPPCCCYCSRHCSSAAPAANTLTHSHSHSVQVTSTTLTTHLGLTSASPTAHPYR